MGGSRRRSPVSLSEQEAYVLRHDEELLEERALAILRPLVLTWLEAAVLLHHYCYGWRLPDVASIVGRHYSEVRAAQDSLITKVATALGYIEGEVERAELPMTTEERRAKVAELRRQGLSAQAIAERLGVAETTVWHDINALEAAGAEDPIREARRAARARRARIVELRAQGLSTVEIARQVGLSPGRVRSELYRARKKRRAA